MNLELERNFVNLNLSICVKNGVGVTGCISTPLNPSVGGIILAYGTSIHASTTFEDIIGTCALCFSSNCDGW